jgi:hypothetical protein
MNIFLFHRDLRIFDNTTFFIEKSVIHHLYHSVLLNYSKNIYKFIEYLLNIL